jgi:hypothetical protein
MEPELAVPDNISAAVAPVGKDGNGRSAAVVALIQAWASIKDAAEEIHVDESERGRTYTRFTTDAVSKLLPDTTEANSGWGTRNHYFYKVVNAAGKEIHMQLALSSRGYLRNRGNCARESTSIFPSRFIRRIGSGDAHSSPTTLRYRRIWATTT